MYLLFRMCVSQLYYATSKIPMSVTPPTTKNVSTAIKQVKSMKAVGPDIIPPEVLKSDIKVTAKMLHTIFRKILKEGEVSTDWKEGHFVMILK